MNRCLAFLLALLFACMTVSSACVAAAPSEWIHFTLQQERSDTDVRALFSDEARSNRSSWTSSFRASELLGLDLAGFRAGGTRPFRFALVREAGRLDCFGQGGHGQASGSCSFTADPSFIQLLANRGIERPSRDEAFSMMALDVRRELIDALAAAHYPAPTIDDLLSLTAVDATGSYIAALGRAGYRPKTIHSLVEFRALDVTPEWIAGFARLGYGGIPAEELIQLRALDVSPEFAAGFDRIGYRHLPVATLVQLKALDISPEFVRHAIGQRSTLPPVSELMDMKMFGTRR